MSSPPAIKPIALADLSPDTPFRYRDPLGLWPGAAALCASVGRVGVVDPIWIRQAPGRAPELVHGHRRVEAARAAGLGQVPARVIHGGPNDILARAVEVHATAGDQNLREVARAIRAGLDLGMGEGEVASRLLPALGLEPHPELARRHLRLLGLSPELLQLLLRKGFSLRRCLPFCDLSGEEARLLARVGQGLGARQIEEAATALREVSARDGIPLRRLVEELGLDPADREGLQRLAARRHPEVTALRRRAADLCEQIGAPDMRASVDPNFTRDGVEIRARLEDGADLQRLIGRLGQPDTAELLRRLQELLR